MTDPYSVLGISPDSSPVYSISVAARAKMSVDEFGRYYGMLFERVPKDHVSYHIEPFT